MAIAIEILSISKNTVPTAKGSYDVFEVAYKKDGKVEGKKVMSFTNRDVTKALLSAKQGDRYEVTTQKNDKGYWEWTAMIKADATEASQSATTAPSAGTKSHPVKGDWETREERLARQVYIVRQSSLSAAVALLKTEKNTPDVDAVIDVARKFEAYVFEKEAPPAAGVRADFSDLEDDIPL